MSLANGGASIIARLQPDSAAAFSTCCKRAGAMDTTAGLSASRVSCQKVADACGSRSKTAALLPSISAATARAVAMVVFPTPPFWLMIASVFMGADFFSDAVFLIVFMGASRLNVCDLIRVYTLPRIGVWIKAPSRAAFRGQGRGQES